MVIEQVEEVERRGSTSRQTLSMRTGINNRYLRNKRIR
jgi:hypothetical protein